MSDNPTHPNHSPESEGDILSMMDAAFEEKDQAATASPPATEPAPDPEFVEGAGRDFPAPEAETELDEYDEPRQWVIENEDGEEIPVVDEFFDVRRFGLTEEDLESETPFQTSIGSYATWNEARAQIESLHRNTTQLQQDLGQQSKHFQDVVKAKEADYNQLRLRAEILTSGFTDEEIMHKMIHSKLPAELQDFSEEELKIDPTDFFIDYGSFSREWVSGNLHRDDYESDEEFNAAVAAAAPEINAAHMEELANRQAEYRSRVETAQSRRLKYEEAASEIEAAIVRQKTEELADRIASERVAAERAAFTKYRLESRINGLDEESRDLLSEKLSGVVDNGSQQFSLADVLYSIEETYGARAGDTFINGMLGGTDAGYDDGIPVVEMDSPSRRIWHTNEEYDKYLDERQQLIARQHAAEAEAEYRSDPLGHGLGDDEVFREAGFVSTTMPPAPPVQPRMVRPENRNLQSMMDESIY